MAHVSGKKLAKTVIVKIDSILAMAVIPASFHVDLDRLKKLTGAGAVELATELEFKDAFPDRETGAMPPFGNLYDMAVYADTSLAENEELTFSAGTPSRTGSHALDRPSATRQPGHPPAKLTDP